MLFKLRMRDFVVLSLKMILLMENLSRMKEKSGKKGGRKIIFMGNAEVECGKMSRND